MLHPEQGADLRRPRMAPGTAGRASVSTEIVASGKNAERGGSAFGVVGLDVEIIEFCFIVVSTR